MYLFRFYSRTTRFRSEKEVQQDMLLPGKTDTQERQQLAVTPPGTVTTYVYQCLSDRGSRSTQHRHVIPCTATMVVWHMYTVSEWLFYA